MSKMLRSIIWMALTLLMANLFAAIEMKAIYPSSFYDAMMVEDGIMVTLQEIDDDYSTMKVYDAQNPAELVELSSLIVLLRSPHQAKLYRSHVYIPDLWGMRLRRYSLIDPAHPVLNFEYSFNMVGYRDMAFSGDYLLMSTQSLGLRVINIANESTANEVGHFTDTNPLMKVWACGDHAAVLSYNMASQISVLKVLDISNPSSPADIGEIDLPYYSYNDLIEVAFYADYMHVIRSGHHTRVFNLSYPSPVYMDDLEYGLSHTVFDGGYRYCTSGGSIRIQVLEEPLLPVDIATFDIMHDNYQRLVIDLPYIYLIGEDYSTYAYCLDLSELEPAPEIMHSFDTGLSTSSLAGWQEWLYYRANVAELSGGGEIIQSTPCNELATVALIKAEENLLHATSSSGLSCSLWSKNVPHQPQLLTTIPGNASETFVFSDRLFIIGSGNLRCHDISIPEEPVFLFSFSGSYRSVICDGDLFWAISYSTLDTYTMQDAQQPILIRSISLGGDAPAFSPRMARRGDYIYVSGYSSEIRIYNVADPLNIVYAGRAILPMAYDAVALAPWFSSDGKLALVSGIANQLVLYDLSDPVSPIYDTHLSLPYKMSNFHYYQDYFIFKRAKMIYTVEMPEQSTIDDPVLVPVHSSILSSHPNPFKGSSSISIDMSYIPLAKTSKVELGIYNLKGQKIRRLIVAAVSRGTHSVIWDSKDERGYPCAKGIYYVKLYLDAKPIAVRKITLLGS